MPLATEIGAILLAYLIGSLSPGYWLVRWRTGTDLRQQFSGSTGARNAGRVLGRTGFALTVILDAAKGALPVVLGRGLGLSEGWLAAAAVAVVIGHIWPATLRFHGGRGLVPALAAIAVLQPPAAIMILVVAGVMLAITRWANLAALAAATAAPYLAMITGAAPAVIIGIGVMAGLVVIAQLQVPAAIGRWLRRGTAAGASAAPRPGPGARHANDERSGDG